MSHDEQIEFLKGLVGAKVAAVRPGVGSFITIVLLANREQVDVEILLWVYLCDWSITHGEIDIASDTSVHLDADLAIAQCLIGETLIDVVEIVPREELQFHFSGDYRLEVWVSEQARSSDKLLMVYVNSRHVFSYGAEA